MISCVTRHSRSPASTNATNTNWLYLRFNPVYFTSREYIRSYSACWPTARPTDQPSVQRPPSKWDEIRAVNNKGGTLSSWDLIRQSHERNKMSPPSSSQPSTHSSNPVGGAAREGGIHGSHDSPGLDSSIAIDEDGKKWGKRALDEAQFEAVLEAERRRASKA